MEPLELYFDYVSPYAYIAWSQIHALAEEFGREVIPRPVLFAAMLTANDTKGPAEIPSKRIYTFIDVSRTASVLGLPLVPPPSHPFNPLLALRVSGLELPVGVKRALITRLFEAAWAGGPGVTDREVVARVAEEAGVTDALARAGSPESKARLRATTEMAMLRGVFGVPSVLVGGELFWGYDSFGHLRRRLDGTLKVDDASVAKWIDLPASAQRKDPRA
ncbi:MAG: 2-hydroxychromene-2-carboxylate isomerase [Myxococcota bacterium]